MASSLSYIYQLASNIPSQALKFTKKVATHPITTFVIGLPFEQWFHEKGHCLTADLLFNNSEPRINYIGGVIPELCSYYNDIPSVLGTHLGDNNSRILLSAAGPLAEIAILTSIAACSSKSVAKRLLPFSCYLNLYSLTILFPGAGGDFNNLLERSIIAYGTMTMACVLTTAFIALRSFKKEQEKIVSKTE